MVNTIGGGGAMVRRVRAFWLEDEKRRVVEDIDRLLTTGLVAAYL